MTDATIELRASPDLLRARLAARALAQSAGLGVMDQTRFVTAVSELARNALIHAHDGRCSLQDRSEPQRVVLEAVVSDAGPGIADLGRALEDGFSTGGSLGAGLPGTRRIVDHFAIESGPGGTIVTIQMHRRRRGA